MFNPKYAISIPNLPEWNWLGKIWGWLRRHETKTPMIKNNQPDIKWNCRNSIHIALAAVHSGLQVEGICCTPPMTFMSAMLTRFPLPAVHDWANSEISASLRAWSQRLMFVISPEKLYIGSKSSSRDSWAWPYTNDPPSGKASVKKNSEFERLGRLKRQAV